MKEYGLTLVFFALLAMAPLEVQPQEKGTTLRVEIGPNVRVSDKGVSHVEAYIAANPEDPRNLIIAASHNVEGKGVIAEAFFTTDAGKTWAVSPLPRLREALFDNKFKHAVDVWVTYAPDGMAYLSTLADMKTQERGADQILVYRSEDQGKTWHGPTLISPRRSFDRPLMVAVGTKNNKRIHIAASDGRGFAVLRSDDGGLSFKTTASIEPDNLAHQPKNPLLLSDGSLLVPYNDYPPISVKELGEIRRDPRKQRLNSSRIYVVRSRDGGLTFDLPQFVADIPRMIPDGLEMALDLSNSRFRGRIYAAWNGEREDSRNMTIAYSTDAGKSWLKSVAFQAENAGPAFFPTIAVSPDGTVGVSWLQQEAGEGKLRCYRIYVAASIDGGETFTPPHVVSDIVSCPDRASNKETIGRWARGGDYMGLAAAADGSFHPVWVDARDGAFQVHTARIELRKGT
ncbi:MAG: sialidase family protein [Pyrinomonadaceae bacterium]